MLTHMEEMQCVFRT